MMKQTDRVKVLPLLIGLCFTLALASGGTLTIPPLPASDSINSITSRDLKKHISFLASDELGGRYTFSPSNRIAARYLAAQLESYGYRGAAKDGSFFQRVPFASMTLDDHGNRSLLTANTVKKEFSYPRDYIFYTTGDHSILKVSAGKLRARLAGELVFVGYGISSPGNNHDDYKGLDVKGKIVVRVDNKPEALKDVKLAPEERQDGAAAAHGAIGGIVISTGLQRMWNGFSSGMMEEERRLWPRADLIAKGVRESEMIIDPKVPEVLAGPALVKAITGLLGQDETYLSQAEGRPLQPKELGAAIEINSSINLSETPQTFNVVGILEGSDPVLKNEYIVLSAHYDHLAGNDGVIYNGADDNGSGTAGILEVAQAFASGTRPKRSVVVAFFTAEEIGLVGSQFNTNHEPVVPLAKTIANFNMDMIGRSQEDENPFLDPKTKDRTSDRNAVFILGDDKHSSALRTISEQSNSELTRLRLDYTYNNLKHPSKLYSRTDSYNFARNGVPVITYFTGWHSDYHKPTDDLEKLDFDKMERISRLAFATSWRVANMGERLPIDNRTKE